MKKYKLAIVGSGALGSIIGEVVCEELSEKYEILGIFSETIENASKLSEKLSCKTYNNLHEMIEDKPDYIIEAATPSVVKNIGVKILESGINLIPLSVGAFADRDFYKIMEQKALENNVRVHIPSGAVGGFDVLRGSMLVEEVDVTVITQKSPQSLEGAPFLTNKKLSPIKTEEIFRGPAIEAIKHFPQNVNVAVATALATRGVDDTQVIIESVPGSKSNKHEIRSRGETIKVDVSIESTPSEDNPKSSTLAAYSVIALLENLVSPITF